MSKQNMLSLILGVMVLLIIIGIFPATLVNMIAILYPLIMTLRTLNSGKSDAEK